MGEVPLQHFSRGGPDLPSASQMMSIRRATPGVWGVGFRDWGVGRGVWGVGLGVWGLGFGVWGVGCGVWGLGFGALGLGFRGFELLPKMKWFCMIHFAPSRIQVQGYLAHKKTSPVGPYSRTLPRALLWSSGKGAVSYERGTPAKWSVT